MPYHGKSLSQIVSILIVSRNFGGPRFVPDSCPEAILRLTLTLVLFK